MVSSPRGVVVPVAEERPLVYLTTPQSPTSFRAQQADRRRELARRAAAYQRATTTAPGAARRAERLAVAEAAGPASPPTKPSPGATWRQIELHQQYSSPGRELAARQQQLLLGEKPSPAAAAAPAPQPNVAGSNVTPRTPKRSTTPLSSRGTPGSSRRATTPTYGSGPAPRGSGGWEPTKVAIKQDAYARLSLCGSYRSAARAIETCRSAEKKEGQR
jgi:hypothetical protein